MTRGERHAYEEHLTNVVILEDAIETAEEIGEAITLPHRSAFP